jgi:hypothetical protein
MKEIVQDTEKVQALANASGSTAPHLADNHEVLLAIPGIAVIQPCRGHHEQE